LRSIFLDIEKLIKIRRLIKRMKLSGHVSREYKGKEYEKLWVVIPHKLIEKLGWKRGDDLEADVKDKKLIIKRD